MVYPEQASLYFDSDCGFCLRWVRAARGLDWLRLLRFVPLQSAEARNRGLAESHTLSQAVLVRKGRQWGGWHAVKRVLFRLPLLYAAAAALVATAFASAGLRLPALGLTLFAALALSPLGNPAGEALYRWIARNRQCRAGSACTLTNR